MTDRMSDKIGNRLIEGFSCPERDSILACAEPIDLVFGTVVCEPDAPLPYAYFPLSGFISLVQAVSGNPPFEMAMIGNEGMLGATLALGVRTAQLRAAAGGDGTALRIPSDQFLRLLRTSPALMRVIKRYVFVLLAQSSQSTACARFHEVEPRLARFLLMAHDRVHGGSFRFTHLYLAGMLGVQRSAVTIAAGLLQERKLISYARGKILVLSRAGLEAAACECYAAYTEDYDSLFSAPSIAEA